MKELEQMGNFENTRILRNVDWSFVPECVKNDLIEIHHEFGNLYKPSFPTAESINKALNLLKKQDSKTLTAEEKTALKDMKRIPWIKCLRIDAANEYRDAMCKAFGAPKLDIDVKIWPSAGEVIYLDHMLRHPYKMATIQKLSKLRCKARRAKAASFEKDVLFFEEDKNVGF